MTFLRRPGRSRGGAQRLSRDLRRALALHDVHLSRRHVHLEDGLLAPLAPMVKRISPDVAVSLRLHGLDVVYPHALYQRLLRASLPSCDRVVCISRATADEARERGARDDQIVVIPPGVWPGSGPLVGRAGWKGPDPFGGPMLLTVGRLIPRKGHVWFIENVLPLLGDVRYMIIGSGPEERRIRECIAHRRSVTLLTSADDTVRDACYAQADLFVMPNVRVPGDMEGFGIVCIEASVRGVPVVAADLEGISDAVLPETGKCFRSRDAEACVDAIRTILDRRSDPASISASTLRAFSWGHLIHRYAHEVFNV